MNRKERSASQICFRLGILVFLAAFVFLFLATPRSRIVQTGDTIEFARDYAKGVEMTITYIPPIIVLANKTVMLVAVVMLSLSILLLVSSFLVLLF